MGKGLLSKAISLAMAPGESIAHLKFVFLEEKNGDADAAVAALCEKLAATVIGEKKLSTSDLAILQLMEDSSYHLAALRSPDPVLYAGWFFGVKGSRLFEPYGFLRDLLDPWPAKGMATVHAGVTEAKVDHQLGTQVLVEAHPLGFLPRSWKVTGRCDRLSWEVSTSALKLDRPASRDLTFAWRAREDPAPRCDVCGAKLTMELQRPGEPEHVKVGGHGWEPE